MNHFALSKLNPLLAERQALLRHLVGRADLVGEGLERRRCAGGISGVKGFEDEPEKKGDRQ